MIARRTHVAGFDLTPMIDVVLLLIIFFLVTAQFSRLAREPVALPEETGRERDMEDDSGALVVDLLGDGTLRVESEVVSLDVLGAMVRQEVASSPETTAVLIRPDRATAAIHLNELARELVASGVVNYRIATSPDGVSP
ncbi:MAG: biopolymer transporter ExbD [Planctomycetota bacterium]